MVGKVIGCGEEREKMVGRWEGRKEVGEAIKEER